MRRLRKRPRQTHAAVKKYKNKFVETEKDNYEEPVVHQAETEILVITNQ